MTKLKVTKKKKYKWKLTYTDYHKNEQVEKYVWTATKKKPDHGYYDKCEMVRTTIND